VPQSAKHDSRMLLTLERYRELALEEAQNVHVRCTEVLEKENTAYAKLDEALQSTYTAHRTTLEDPGRSLSPDAMRLAYYHALAQSTALAQARLARDRTHSRVTQAQDRVAARLEEVKVIERLRENRRRNGSKWERRQAQSQLDELGIIRMSREGQWPSAE
jgi:hypothetical protein